MNFLKYFMIFLCIMTNSNVLPSLNLFDRDLTKAKPDIDGLSQELKITILSAQILQRTIAAILSKKYEQLDGTVGECKCQVRTSQLLDLAPNFAQQAEQLNLDMSTLEKIENHAQAELTRLANMSHSEKSTFAKQLKEPEKIKLIMASLSTYSLQPEVKFAAQCFATNPFNNAFQSKLSLSNSTQAELAKKMKRILCQETIAYEQKLAHQYCNPEVQKTLTHVESLGQTSMTAFFAGIMPILAKMIAARQSMQVNKETFCADCANLQKTSTFCFVSDQNRFQPVASLPQDQVTMIIDGYQYPGSLQQLKERLGIKPTETYIPNSFKKPCTCTHAPQQPDLPEDIADVILNNAAEHFQYISGAEIPFAALELKDSALKQEYERRKFPQGYGIHGMKILSIDHIYPALPK